MQQTITEFFPAGYGSTKHVTVEAIEKAGSFSLFDKITCEQAVQQEANLKKTICIANCNQEVAKFKSGSTTYIINHEEYIGNFKIPAIARGGRCDSLIYNDQTIAFVEMTCSAESAIEDMTKVDGAFKPGKRAVAYNQLEQSISRMRFVPQINNKIDSFANRLAIFACRMKNVASTANPEEKPANNMTIFGKFTDSADANTGFKDMGNGFMFKMVRYPEEICI